MGEVVPLRRPATGVVVAMVGSTSEARVDLLDSRAGARPLVDTNAVEELRPLGLEAPMLSELSRSEVLSTVPSDTPRVLHTHTCKKAM